MDEKDLKTSPKQRIIIGAVAVVLIGSIIASYAAIVAGNGNSSKQTAQTVDPEKVAVYQQAYDEQKTAFGVLTQADFDKFYEYHGEITAYNENSANENGLQTRDLLEGTGRELAEGDDDYYAYYVGWCADETIFDSSFNDNTTPTAFGSVLAATGMSPIEGWQVGLIGTKLGGVREITIPGELAYQDTREICGGTNKPLKFMVMPIEPDEALESAYKDLVTAQLRYVYATMGVDSDAEGITTSDDSASGSSAEGASSSESSETPAETSEETVEVVEEEISE